ncbi:NACHT, LRR and PYD domains-containing protein 3-like [Chanos chanos]|uniref:NACHT, LRR and PYD domains-containing protein 3-like n=1 Tax=Chanos chanos TaxID=29144 RepID=A0A6J2V8R4_CHACN|nr:NACHT, LRR and PYD domains-containing protein 3-like [Chanos chanos]
MEQPKKEQSVGCHSAEGLSVSASAQTGGHITAPVLSHTTVTGNITVITNVSGSSNPADTHSQNPGKTSQNLKDGCKKLICSEYAYVTEYNSLPGEHVLLTDRYTELLIIQRHREQSEREKEIRSRGEKFFTARANENYITVEKFFSPDDRGLIPKAVVLQGNPGNGKSFTAMKIMLDWASGKLYAENFDFIFHLKCKEINQISGEKSLAEFLRYSQSLTPAQISQILQHSSERVLFLVDGFDELKLSQDNMSNLSLPTDVQTPASPESTLKALLSGRLLPESFLLVTTRSTATDTLSKLLKKQPQRFTDITGFSERGVEEYFQRFFKDDQLLQTQAYEHVKANETLFTACFIPVICWIICTVFRERCRDGLDASSGLDTTTSIYVDFVSTLLEHHCQGLSQSVPSLLRSLGQLAERGMLEQQVLFNEKSVSETVSDPANIPFLCKFLFRRRIRQETMFSFMHLSFQEFFTALYYVLMSEEESQRAVIKLIEGTKLYRSSVIQFLFGLCNKEVSSSLMESHSVSVSPTVRALLEEWILQVITDKKKYLNEPIDLFFFHCLYELHEEDFVRETLESFETIKMSYDPLRMTDCRVLLYCLQCCSHIRSLNLQHYSLTPETLKILQPAVCRSQELWLDLMDFSDDDVGLLISALGEDKKVNSLRFSNSFLSDQALQRVLNSLSRQRSVAELYLTVKTITTSTAVILMNHLCNNEITGEMSVVVNENSHEESLCSCLRASNTFGGIICPGFDENLKALLSFLMSEPDVTYVTLNVMDLTESWASRILPHLQVFPNLNHIRVGCVREEFDELGISWSFNESQTDRDLRLFFTAQNFTQSDVLFRTSDSPTPLSLSEFCLTGPQSELLNIDWKSVIQIFCKFKDKPITEMCGEDFDEKMDALLSLLPSVCGLKTVEMKMSDLTVNLAVRIISLIQTCPGLHNVNSPEFNEHVNALLSFLNSVPGLKFICVGVASLTESWVTRILSLIQTCPSLQRVR